MSEANDFRLEGEVALITGGGTGLGLGMAEAMVRSGAHVVITGRRESVLKDAVGRLGSNASYIVADVTESGAAERLTAEVVARHKTLSILVNNAGIHLKELIEDTSEDEFARLMHTHVNAAFLLSREAVPVMRKNGHGHILFIASMASFIGMPKIIAYSAAKSAQTGMVRSLAVELGSDNIRVNGIAPGWIESDMLNQALNADPPRKQKITGRIPGGQFGLPRDIGNAAVFLSSPAARYINGVILPVDGGALISL
ncbi:MAG: glucose 1-dehydrogenase [Spirochaetaceae bacterium]|nr:MAG: glucose 1-dehydrogenase [Spirochaetaceae bacterium]